MGPPLVRWYQQVTDCRRHVHRRRNHHQIVTMALFDIVGVNPPYPNGLTPLWVDKINTLETTATGDQTAAEIRELVDGATDSNVFTDADHTNLGAIKVEGGGVVVTGTADPTSGGANTGDDSIIGGEGNHTNSGPACIIVGDGNVGNSGRACIISGEDNHTNSGDFCIIGCDDNSNNSGDFCIIGGEYNTWNSGDHCIIGGFNNVGNFGSHSIIGGKVTSASTLTATSNTSAEADDNLITRMYHQLVLNQPLRFTTLTGGEGLSTSILYYARDILTDTFAVALAPDGPAVVISVDYTVANFIANGINYGDYNTIAGQDNEGNSGSWCNISGYQNHTNSGNYCSISGYENYDNSGSKGSISGYENYNNSGNFYSISGGQNHSNDGSYCQISGYGNHTNSGNNCSISGSAATSNNLDYARVHGGGTSSRIIDLVAKCSTSSTTPKAITLGAEAEGTNGSLIIPTDTAWAFRIDVVAIDVTNGYANSKKFSFDGIALNNGGAVSVSSATSGTDAALGTFTGSVAISADTINDALKITATGIGSDTINWTAQVNLTQVN